MATSDRCLCPCAGCVAFHVETDAQNAPGFSAFVHVSAVIEAGFRAFSEGQTVEYEVQHTHKGRQAVALRAG